MTFRFVHIEFLKSLKGAFIFVGLFQDCLGCFLSFFIQVNSTIIHGHKLLQGQRDLEEGERNELLGAHNYMILYVYFVFMMVPCRCWRIWRQCVSKLDQLEIMQDIEHNIINLSVEKTFLWIYKILCGHT